MLERIQQWLFPPICCICERENLGMPASLREGEQVIKNAAFFCDKKQDFCSFCYTTLPWLEDRCYRCGLLIEDADTSVYCQHCLSHPPSFDRLCALFNYQAPISNLVARLKFNERLDYGRILGELFAEFVIKEWYSKMVMPEALLPVPLHKNRLAKRGYNQALELLWPIQKRLKIPILFNACTRVQKTYPQAKLDKNRRKRNMQGVFKVVKPIQVNHVAIMDDVVTTGSTVNALSRVLKEAGVEQIDIWSICRT